MCSIQTFCIILLSAQVLKTYGFCICCYKDRNRHAWLYQGVLLSAQCKSPVCCPLSCLILWLFTVPLFKAQLFADSLEWPIALHGTVQNQPVHMYNPTVQRFTCTTLVFGAGRGVSVTSSSLSSSSYSSLYSSLSSSSSSSSTPF